MRCKCGREECGEHGFGPSISGTNLATGDENAVFCHTLTLCDWYPLGPKTARVEGWPAAHVKYMDAQALSAGASADDLVPGKYPPPGEAL